VTISFSNNVLHHGVSQSVSDHIERLMYLKELGYGAVH